jgi:16S rRNA (guanine966-N2)-methyltransferase
MPLRVIGGALGGRRLEGPPRSGVRPTSDRVREALFEVLGDAVEGARVLDLYSGTGAIGIEALSRGAEWCDFVESDSKAQAVIRENLTRTALLDVSKLYPYEYDRAEAELNQVVSGGLLAEDGILAVEHSQRKPWPQELGGRQQLTSRRYGDTRITIYR